MIKRLRLSFLDGDKPALSVELLVDEKMPAAFCENQSTYLARLNAAVEANDTVELERIRMGGEDARVSAKYIRKDLDVAFECLRLAVGARED